MKYTDVAWDFDGTLFDTYPNIVRSFREALESYGYTAAEEEIRLKMSVTIRDAVKFYSEKYGLDPLELRARQVEIEGFRPDLVAPYPGVCETLKAVRESGRRNHLFTNRDRGALRYLEVFDILQYFDGLITKENIGEYKPAPNGLYVLFSEYQIEPSKLLMVGDRAVDIDAAKAAGADGCFYNTNGIAVPEGVDILLENMVDLLNDL